MIVVTKRQKDKKTKRKNDKKTKRQKGKNTKTQKTQNKNIKKYKTKDKKQNKKTKKTTTTTKIRPTGSEDHAIIYKFQRQTDGQTDGRIDIPGIEATTFSFGWFWTFLADFGQFWKQSRDIQMDGRMDGHTYQALRPPPLGRGLKKTKRQGVWRAPTPSAGARTRGLAAPEVLVLHNIHPSDVSYPSPGIQARLLLPSGRCGPDHPHSDGRHGQCDPEAWSDLLGPCCSADGWCGQSDDHCLCNECVDYRGNYSDQGKM